MDGRSRNPTSEGHQDTNARLRQKITTPLTAYNNGNDNELTSEIRNSEKDPSLLPNGTINDARHHIPSDYDGIQPHEVGTDDTNPAVTNHIDNSYDISTAADLQMDIPQNSSAETYRPVGKNVSSMHTSKICESNNNSAEQPLLNDILNKRYDLPSPDLGYFGSQETVNSNSFDLDSFLAESAESTPSNYVDVLQELTECLKNV